jgi:hypothetical protein
MLDAPYRRCNDCLRIMNLFHYGWYSLKHYRLSKYKYKAEVFTLMEVQVMVFWVVTLCSDVAGYHVFRGSCCLQFNLKMEAAWSSKSLVSYYITK